MPKIHSHNGLTGQVGSVVFLNGVGETEDERMLAYFAENAHAYTVEGAEAEPLVEPNAYGQLEPIVPPEDENPPADPPKVEDNEPAPSWDDLTDEQVAEAYATNVPDGAATTTKGKLKALNALDA